MAGLCSSLLFRLPLSELICSLLSMTQVPAYQESNSCGPGALTYLRGGWGPDPCNWGLLCVPLGPGGLELRAPRGHRDEPRHHVVYSKTHCVTSQHIVAPRLALGPSPEDGEGQRAWLLRCFPAQKLQNSFFCPSFLYQMDLGV